MIISKARIDPIYISTVQKHVQSQPKPQSELFWLLSWETSEWYTFPEVNKRYCACAEAPRKVHTKSRLVETLDHHTGAHSADHVRPVRMLILA